MEEEDVELQRMLLYPLYHWRVLLSGVLIFVLLAGLLVYLPREEEPGTSSYRQYLRDLEVYEQRKGELHSYLDLTADRIRDKQAYLEQSVLLQADPENTRFCKYSLYISTDYQILPSMTYQDPDRTPLILSALQRMVTDEVLVASIAGQLALEPWQVRELISVYTDSSTLQITVTADTAQRAETVMGLLKEHLPGILEDIHESYGAFTASVLQDSSFSQTAVWLYDLKETALSDLLELRDTYSRTEEALKALKRPAYQKPLRFLIPAFLLGLLLPWAFYCAELSLKHSLWRTEPLSATAPVLGILPHPGKLTAPDRWIRKLDDRCLLPREEALALAAAGIRTCAPRTLLVTGSCPRQLCRETVEALQALLPEYTLIHRGSLLESADSLEALSDCQGVLLLEQVLVSRTAQIRRQLQRIRSAGKPVIGFLVIDL